MSTRRNSAQQSTGLRDSESKPPRKIILLGKTGDGKSHSGNTILNEQRFTTASSPESITAQFQTEVAMVFGRTVTVIDTPGIFDTRLDEAVIRSEIIGSIIECAPAVDAFVIVLKVQRYTKHEIEILDKIFEYCGEETFKHAVVLFTHGEELEGQTIKEFVKISPKLQELVNKCGGRCHVFDNKHWNNCHLGYRSNKFHVKNLMETIDKMVQENGCFTKLISGVDKEIQEEINSMDTIHLCPEEKREAAKKNVRKKIIIRLAGVATGTLTGAFLGIGVAVGSVVALLKAAKFKDVFKAIATTVTSAGKVADKVAVAAAAGGAAAAGTASLSALAGAVEAGVAGGVAAGATAAAGVVAVEAGVAAGATAAGAIAVEAGIVTGTAAGATAGAVAVEAGVAASAGIGAAAGSGIAVGVILGAAALAGAVGGGITGYKAAEEADSVLDAIKFAVKTNYANAKDVVTKAEQLPSNVYKQFQ